MKATALLLIPSLVGCGVSAVTFSAKARRSSHVGFNIGGHSPHPNVFAVGNNSTEEEDDGDIDVDNHGDLVYSTAIKLGGQQYGVQIDTGSSDLWIYSPKKPVKVLNTTSINAKVTYGKGTANGPIALAELEFGEYKVPSQAFINAVEAIDLESTLVGGNSGLIGLSFDSGSSVDKAVKKKYGDKSTLGRTPISNIFHQNPKIPNFITVLLGRTNDLNDEVEGVFTISEYIEEFKAIENEPKIPREDVQKKGARKRWNAKVQGIDINGHKIPLKSALPKVKSGSAIAMLDTGWSYPPVDPKIADAIYSSIPGSVKVADSETWVVPCMNATELVFKLGGKEYPIHPLDLTIVNEVKGSDGSTYTYCTNSFQGENVAKWFGDLDMILGASFMKNVYTVFDWGNESDGGKEGPFMQLLSTTTFAEAVPEFLQVRAESLKSLHPEIAPASLLPLMGKRASQVASSDGIPVYNGKTVTLVSEGPGTDSQWDDLLSKVNGYIPAIVGLLAANLFFVLLLCGLGLVMCIRGKGRSKSVSQTYAPVRARDTENHPALYNPYDAQTYRD